MLGTLRVSLLLGVFAWLGACDDGATNSLGGSTESALRGGSTDGDACACKSKGNGKAESDGGTDKPGKPRDEAEPDDDGPGKPDVAGRDAGHGKSGAAHGKRDLAPQADGDESSEESESAAQPLKVSPDGGSKGGKKVGKPSGDCVCS